MKVFRQTGIRNQ